jgi:hypothetical protein
LHETQFEVRAVTVRVTKFEGDLFLLLSCLKNNFFQVSLERSIGGFALIQRSLQAAHCVFSARSVSLGSFCRVVRGSSFVMQSLDALPQGVFVC